MPAVLRAGENRESCVRETFGCVIGQPRACRLLADGLAHGRLFPAYLFVGPQGTGKRTLGLELARALACERDVEPAQRPCGDCPACGRVTRGVHVDVCVLRAPTGKRLIPVESVREADSTLRLKPLESRRRVLLIDGAECLTGSAQNALLKTLEEPPPLSHLILVTARPEALLDTVVSRCPRIPFQPLDVAHIETILKRQGIAEAEVRWRATHARGSVSGALDELLRERVEAGGLLLEALAGKRLATALGAQAGDQSGPSDPFAAADAVVAASVAVSSGAGDTLEGKRQAVQAILSEAAETLRLGLSASVGSSQAGAIDAHRLRESGGGSERLEELLGLIAEARLRIDRNVSLERVLSGMFLGAQVG